MAASVPGIRVDIDRSQRSDLAGQTVSQGQYNVTYGDNGYVTGYTNTAHPGLAGTANSIRAASIDAYSPNRASGTALDQQYLSNYNLNQINALRQQAQRGQISWAEANAQANDIRSRYGYGSVNGVTPGNAVSTYTGNPMYAVPGSASYVTAQKLGLTNQADAAARQTAAYNAPYRALQNQMQEQAAQYQQQLLNQQAQYQQQQTAYQRQLEAQQAAYQQQLEAQQAAYRQQMEAAQREAADREAGLRQNLNDWIAQAEAQTKLQSQYAVNQGVNQLLRAREDAQAQFAAQRDQIAAAEAIARDNQALYNTRRGDAGGIGAAQYDSIANTAAQSRQMVSQAQTRLSTDTARQIADLRAQGDFRTADELLQLSQSYLSQLTDLQKWAAEYGLSVDQFRQQMARWQDEYELDAAALTGQYRGLPTLAAQNQAFNRLAAEAALTGYYNGAPTLAAQNQLFQQDATRRQLAMREAELTGYYNGSPTPDYQNQLFNRSVAERELALRQTAEDFERAYRTAGLTGYYDGAPTVNSLNTLAQAGVALAQAGIQPSASQAEAMASVLGYSATAVNDLVQAARLTQRSSGGSSSRSGGSGSSRSAVSAVSAPSAGDSPSGGMAGTSITGEYAAEDRKWSEVNEYVAGGGKAENFFRTKEKAREYGYSSMSAAVRAYEDYLTRRANRKSTTVRDLGSLDYDPDEGIFTWNGKRYNSAEALQTALNGAKLTENQSARLRNALRAYGFSGE